jgi:hypothetical protein
MPARVQVIFWSATTASVLLLGVVWALTRAGGASVEGRVLLVVAGAGLAATSLVAARIVFVLGRLKRHRRACAAALPAAQECGHMPSATVD